MRLISKVCAFLAIMLLAGCNREIEESDFKQFEKGKIVGVYSANKDRDEIVVKTSAGVNGAVIFLSHTSVFIKFQDEKTERKICDVGWIFYSEIRQIKEQDLLFIEITGSRLTKYNEWENDKRMFVYKLSTRKLIGSAKSE